MKRKVNEYMDMVKLSEEILTVYAKEGNTEYLQELFTRLKERKLVWKQKYAHCL